MHEELALDVPPVPGWPRGVKSVVLCVISMAHYAIVAARGWAANRINARVRLSADKDRLKQEVELVRGELRIKNARMARIHPRHRPHYRPIERMAILELKAVQGWTVAQAARQFLVEAATVASWLGRLDKEEPGALVQLSQPVNRFPDFVRYIVQRLKILCPSLGKRKIAQMLARAGLHLGATTIRRVLKEKPAKPPAAPSQRPIPTGRVVTADYPDHVHHVDLSVVPTSPGLWASWLPFALPQAWPFA